MHLHKRTDTHILWRPHHRGCPCNLSDRNLTESGCQRHAIREYRTPDTWIKCITDWLRRQYDQTHGSPPLHHIVLPCSIHTKHSANCHGRRSLLLLGPWRILVEHWEADGEDIHVHTDTHVCNTSHMKTMYSPQPRDKTCHPYDVHQRYTLMRLCTSEVVS